MTEGNISPVLKEIWATIRPSLDVDIVNTYEKLHSEFGEEFTKEQLAKGKEVMYYPTWYFIDKPFLTAIELQMLRDKKKEFQQAQLDKIHV